MRFKSMKKTRGIFLVILIIKIYYNFNWKRENFKLCQLGEYLLSINSVYIYIFHNKIKISKETKH